MNSDDRKSEKDWLDIDKCNKAIPVLLLCFVIGSFLFNLAYFINPIIGLGMMSLLSPQDYYEGTAPCIAVVFFYSLPVAIIYPCIDSIKKIFHQLLKICFYLCRVIELFFRLTTQRFMLRRIKKKDPYHDEVLAALDNAKKEIGHHTVATVLSYLLNYFYLILLICFLVIPLILILLSLKVINPPLFAKYLIILIVLVVFIPILRIKQKNMALAIYSLIIVFLMGFLTFFKDYYDTTRLVYTKENSKHQLIRALSKGVLLKKEDATVLFLEWENIKSIEKKDHLKFTVTFEDNVSWLLRIRKYP